MWTGAPTNTGTTLILWLYEKCTGEVHRGIFSRLAPRLCLGVLVVSMESMESILTIIPLQLRGLATLESVPRTIRLRLWGAVDAVGTNREGRAARTGEVIEVSHMGGGVENGRNGEVDDEDLEEPEEQEEEAQSKRQGKQPARQAQLKKRKKQPENGGEAQGGATGSGSGKRKKRA